MALTTLLLASALSPLAAQTSSAGTELPTLFTATSQAPAPGVGLSTPAKRQRVVTVDLRLLQRLARAPESADSLALNLFDDRTLVADFSSLEAAPNNGWIWKGDFVGDDGGVTISVVQTSVSATVQYGEELYRVAPAGDGIHWIVDAPADHGLECGMGEEHEVTSPVGLGGGSGGAARGTGLNDIDTLVVYSTAAKNVSGGTSGMQSKINLAVTETNDAYNFSGVNHRLVLVHTEEMIGYNEPSSFSQILTDLRATNDGDMDNVHQLRDQYGADVVAMICQNGQYCGIAYLMTNVSPNFASSAFSVTNYSCATGYYSFGHEIGHNMGSNHDPQNASSGAYSYSFGFRTSNNQYRTIMAYSPGTRIKRFSSPNVTYNGFVMGDNNQDNARSMNNASDTIAGWRNTVPDSPTLTVLALISGFSTSATLEECTPNGAVVLALSTAGDGPTTTIYGVADLSPPIIQLPSVTVDANGDGSVPLSIPGGTSGTTVWFQALDLGSGEFSNGQQQTIL